jgi:hypothetical protein
MRYRLRTLMVAAGIIPPACAFVWFHWRDLMILGVCLTLIALWFWVSLSIARFCGWLVASMMG